MRIPSLSSCDQKSITALCAVLLLLLAPIPRYHLAAQSTSRVDSLLRVASKQQKSDLESAKVTADLALSLTDSTEYDHARVLTILGRINWTRGDITTAHQQYDRAISLLTQLDSIRLLTKARSNKAILYASKGEYQKGIEMFQKVRATWAELGDSLEIAKQDNSLGVAHRSMGDNEAAIKYFNAALKYCHRADDNINMVRTSLNIAKLLRNMGLFDEALSDLCKLEPLAPSLEDKNLASNVYSSLGLVYNNLGDYKEALKSYNEAVKLKQKLGAKRDLANMYGNMSFMQVHLNNKTEAIKLARSAYDYGVETGNKYVTYSGANALGNAYLHSSFPEQAESVFRSALEIAKAAESPKDIAPMHHYLAQSLMASKDYESAYYHLSKYQHINDSLLASENIAKVTEIRQQYNEQRQLAEIARGETMIAQLERKSLAQTVLLIGLLLTIGLVFFLLRVYKRTAALQATEMGLLNEQYAQLTRDNEELLAALTAEEPQESPTDILDQIIVLSNREKSKVRIGDIIMVKANDAMITIYTAEDRHHIWQRLKDFKELLPDQYFKTPHRSYIVNTNKVVAVHKTELELEANLTARLTRGNAEKFS